MKETIKSLLKSLGVVKSFRLILTFFIRERLMKFPTFPNDINKEISSQNDYFRYAAMCLAIQRLNTEGVRGNLAEVGVYRGDSCRILHKLTSGRLYYLFDTFEGFPKEDLEGDNSEDNRFKNTSVESVLKNIGSDKNIVIRKGYIPQTLQGLEDEEFAFVLLDLDLYAPTKRSLEFFYPRLVKGGYIFIHDYNNPESNWACNRAVNEFMLDKCEKIIEIPDTWGSAVLRKI